ncbi:MAG: ABC transporter permease [Blastocatellia bacterium]|nr:ABC transporter permease [Blastocatellia bacterium]MCS7156357.1 ABC transporter permease [Blastocatellia bacterium]MCX7751292.1 ABC transporter permease [Blastocatellia bacterium]MDW8169004.1 ABC transporter permease [Acidobacteriota bacterium]MDW8256763.1 ABC transporter permease [Acidobacteriota bacterium]
MNREIPSAWTDASRIFRLEWIVPLLRRFGPLLALLLMSGALAVLSPHFLTFENVLNVFRQSAVNALLALGQLLVIITAGIDLSVGSVLGFCCVLVALLLKTGVPTSIAIVTTLGVGIALGMTNGLLLTKLRLPHPFIPTLGMMNVARGLALVLSGGFPISELPEDFRFWGAGTLGGIPMPVIVVLVVYALFHLFLTHTTVGRDIYAIGGNKQAALLAGIPVDRRLITVYAMSGGLASLGAIILAGRMNSGFPLAGVGAELDAIAAVIIGGASFFGGVGTVWGTLVGALIMGVLRNGLNLLDVSAYWQTTVIGVVIVIAVWVDVLRQRALERRRVFRR